MTFILRTSLNRIAFIVYDTAMPAIALLHCCGSPVEIWGDAGVGRAALQAGIIDEMMGDMMDSAVDADLEEETEEEVDKVGAGLCSCLLGMHGS